MACIGKNNNISGGAGNAQSSCEFQLETTHNSDEAFNGFYKIGGAWVKPVIDTNMDSNTFGHVKRIEQLTNVVEEGGSVKSISNFGEQKVVSPNSDLFTQLANDSEFLELHERTLNGAKWYATQNGQGADAQAAATNSGVGVTWDNLDETIHKKSLISKSAYNELDGNTNLNELLVVDFEGETDNVGNNSEEVVTVEDTPPEEDPENSLSSLAKLDPVLKYPFDALYGPGGQDYIRFEIFKYSPSQPTAGSASGATAEDDASETTGINIVNTIEAGPRRTSNLGQYLSTIKLPIPNDLRTSNGVEWGGARANAIEMAAMGGVVQKIADVKDEGIASTALESVGDIGSLLKTVTSLETNDLGAGTALTAFLSKMLLSKININVDTNQFVARSAGIALNPNLELLFSGPKLRNFTFRFDFAPNGPEDARNSRRIIRLFKQSMLPTGYGSRDGTSSIFIGSPHVYRIGYFTGQSRIKGLPIHKICALTQCSVNFTPENVYQSYEDADAVSQPVRTTMELAFTELTPLFSEDYNMNSAENEDSKYFNSSLSDLKMNSGEGGILSGENSMTKHDIGY